jgi:hypothetical protein
MGVADLDELSIQAIKIDPKKPDKFPTIFQSPIKVWQIVSS